MIDGRKFAFDYWPMEAFVGRFQNHCLSSKSAYDVR